jgi:hypothetical protein
MAKKIIKTKNNVMIFFQKIDSLIYEFGNKVL